MEATRNSLAGAMERLCERELLDVDPPVADAIRYSLLGEGKRLRGLLVPRDDVEESRPENGQIEAFGELHPGDDVGTHDP